MIDLHCHVLPGIDDGAADMDDSIAMARLAAADGVERICATPHIRHDHDVRIHELPERVWDVNVALEERAIPVRILTGGEVAETALHGLDDEELRMVSLASAGGAILLEPAPGPLGDPLEQAVAHLGERGYVAVVAHPERHLGSDFRDRLAALVSAGALIQVTAAALLDEATAPTILELAAAGLVHVLGSDSHSARFGRPPSLRRALEKLTAVAEMRAHIDWITREGPLALVAGEQVRAPFP